MPCDSLTVRSLPPKRAVALHHSTYCPRLLWPGHSVWQSTSSHPSQYPHMQCTPELHFPPTLKLSGREGGALHLSSHLRADQATIRRLENMRRIYATYQQFWQLQVAVQCALSEAQCTGCAIPESLGPGNSTEIPGCLIKQRAAWKCPLPHQTKGSQRVILGGFSWLRHAEDRVTMMT